ncbi:hypothetical protein QUA08_32570, partial [Microcoleus sp. T3B2]
RPSKKDGRDAHPTFKSGSYLILIPKWGWATTGDCPYFLAIKTGRRSNALVQETRFLRKIFGLDANFLGRNWVSDTAW